MGRMVTDIGHVDPAPQGFKYMPCKYCEKPILVGERKRTLPHHIECSVGESAKATRQMANKEGLYYERYLESMARRFGQPPGGGTSTPGPHGGDAPLTSSP